MPGAKEKAAEKAKQQQEDNARRKEDADWEAAGEGKKSKAQAKKVSKDEDRQGAQAKKLEARRLAEEEAAALAASTKKPAAAPKVTRYDLNKNAAAEKERSKKEAAERDMQSRREVDESTYAQQVERVNDNTLDGVDARNVDQALSQLGLEEKPKMKFSQYMERDLPALKESKPGLKAPQYKDILWKKWQRSPDNPLNQK